MAEDTTRSIGKVIPLRQHRRNPAYGSALARLIAQGSSLSPAAGEGGRSYRIFLESVEAAERRRSRALEDDVNRARVVDGALSETQAHLRAMRDAAKVVDDPLPVDRVSAKLAALAGEITRVSENAEFGGQALLSGGAQALLSGDVRIGDPSAAGLGVAALDAGDPRALDRIDRALERVAGMRAALAEIDARLRASLQEHDIVRQNVTAAGTLASDVDAALVDARQVCRWIVAHARHAARSQGVQAGVVRKLVG